MELSLQIRLRGCVKLLLSLRVDIPELEDDGKEDNIEDHLPSANNLENLLVCAPVGFDLLIFLIIEQLSDGGANFIINFVVQASEFLNFGIELLFCHGYFDQVLVAILLNLRVARILTIRQSLTNRNFSKIIY